MIANRKFGIGVLLAAMLVISMVFVPAVSAGASSENNCDESTISASDKTLMSKPNYTITSTYTITPDTPALSEEEFDVYVE